MSEQEKNQVTKIVYSIADEIDWLHLSINEKTEYYEDWTSQPTIGGVLARIVGTENVRVYIKDTIMKNYAKSKRQGLLNLLELMSINFEEVTRTFVKPEGVLCDGTHLYNISTAKQWKIAVASAYERAYECRDVQENTLFITNHTNGRYIDKSYRNMIEAAGLKLGVKIHWVV